MKMYVSPKPDDQILIIQTETAKEAQILNDFERVQGPLVAKVLHGTGYSDPYLEISRSKS